MMDQAALNSELDDTTQPMLPGIEVGAELLDAQPVSSGPRSLKIVQANQARIEGILAARAMGLSIRQVCAAYRVGAHTLAEIERSRGAKLATLKDRFARRLGAFVELGLDRMLESVESMDPDKLPLAVAIAIDKLQVLTGEPSVIVGQGEGPRRFSVESLHARLGEDCIDVTPPAMDSPPSQNRQKGSGAPRASGANSAGSDC